MADSQFHHGITGREPRSGNIFIRDTATSVIGLLAFADDADADFYPLDQPVLITTINTAIAKAGFAGNLRRSLETIQAIVNTTIVVVRIADPFTLGGVIGDLIVEDGISLDDSLVIGTTMLDGKRTGLKAFLTAQSMLGVTPKIIVAPDVETPDVVQALFAINEKLRAFSYFNPRDINGKLLETKEQAVLYRKTLGKREATMIYPEFVSGNVLLGDDSPSNGDQLPPSEGFFIRLDGDLSKSESYYTYSPDSAGSNAEKVINLANLIDNIVDRNAEGWTEWSRALTFEDVNYIASNGGLGVYIHNSGYPNFWVDMDGITTLAEFFEALKGQGGIAIQYANNGVIQL